MKEWHNGYRLPDIGECDYEHERIMQELAEMAIQEMFEILNKTPETTTTL